MPWLGTRERALAAGSATLHESLGRRGALPHVIKPAYAGATLAGPAFTVRSPVGDNLFIHHALYAARPGDILVVDVPGTADYGYWGEILSEAAKARELGGVVITGGVRDVEALRRVGFPVFATTICIRGTGKDPDGDGAFGTSVQLRIGEVVVASGDLVVGDADGLVVVPSDEVAETVARADERRRKEETFIERLRLGDTTVALFDLPELSA